MTTKLEWGIGEKAAGSLGAWIESRIHQGFTMLADDLYGDGYLTREERITLSGAIGDALAAYIERAERDAPEVFTRPTWRKVAEYEAMTDEALGMRARAKAAEGDEGMAAGNGAFRAFKDRDGAWRWVATFSNQYEDLEGETFPAEAHKAFADYVAQERPDIALRLWHVPGADIGKVDHVGWDDSGFMAAVGHFTPGMEHVAKSLGETQVPLAVSHGYTYPRDGLGPDGVYRGGYRSFEISVLPADKAANPLTAFAVEKEAPPMGITAEQRPFFVDVLGEEGTRSLEQQHLQLRERANKEGLSYKAITDALSAVETPEGATGRKDDATAAPDGANTPPPAGDGQGDQNPETPDPDPKPEATAAPAPESTEAFAAAVGKAIGDAMTPVTEVVSELRDGLRAQGEAIKALVEADHAAAKDALQPKGGYARAASAFRNAATQSKETTIPPNDPMAQAASEAERQAMAGVGNGVADDMAFFAGETIAKGE